VSVRYRAWRFLHPDFDIPEAAAGLRLAATGGIEMVEEEASVRQAILLLLSTIPGERVMRPDYGCALERLIFAPNDDTTAGLALHYLRQALDRWEPRIDVLRLDAERDAGDPTRLNLLLEYRVRSTQREDRLAIPVRLAGEEG
jgi:phage baseplate assembly protein W